MARRGHQFGDVEVYDEARVHQGDNYINVTNLYFGKDQARLGIYEILLASLSFDGIGARIRNVAAALPTTCEWLRYHPHFIAWSNDVEMNQRHGLLWLKGKPGSGKSTIMKETLIWAERAWSDQVVLSYFFNARSPHPLDKSSLGLYRSLIWQLLAVLPISRTLFVENFASKVRKKEADGQTKVEVEEWTEVELQNFFIAVIQGQLLQRTTIFIDALDEGADEDVRRMVKFLERLTRYTTGTNNLLRILLSSRHYPHITVAKSLSIVVEDQAEHNRDIELYIQNELVDTMLGREHLHQKVQERSAGVFLWVVLVVPILNKVYDQGRSAATILRKLYEIPQDLRDLFDQIFRENDEDTNECIALLQWVLFAKRPLDPVELYYAIQQTCNQTDDDESGVVSLEKAIKYIRNCSYGLVELTKAEKPTVQFIHETVRDFLASSQCILQHHRSQGPPLGNSKHQFQADTCHEKLVDTCLQYLLQSYRQATLTEEGERFYPLGFYTAEYWWQHLQSIQGPCSERVVQQALELLIDSVDSLLFWVQLYDINRSFPNPYLTVDEINLPLYYTACIGRHELVSSLLALGADVDARPGDDDDTALIAASEKGHEKVVQILLESGADIDARGGRNEYNGTALTVASGEGYEKVVQVLVDAGADVEARQGEYDDTALIAASEKGNEKVVQILVDAGADIDARGGLDKYNDTALTAASQAGHEKVVQVLVDAGADVNARRGIGEDGDTALTTASEAGYEKVVQILVDAGADIGARQGDDDNTALIAASEKGNEKVVQILVDAGADVNAQKGRLNDTALIAASRSGRKKIVQILVDAGADVNAQGLRADGTALIVASRKGYKKIVQILIDAGADVNAQIGRFNNTALIAASEKGHKKVVQILLDAGAKRM